MNISVDHVVPYIGDDSSGPAYSVPALCKGLYERGVNVRLHTLDPVRKNDSLFMTHGYPRIMFPYSPLGLSPAMRVSLASIAHKTDIIHNHSLWMMPNIYSGRAVNKTSCKLIIAPRGTMSPYAWSRSRWKKRIMMLLGQRSTLKRADMFHATCEDELLDIRRLGWRQPVAVIPNGIEIPVLTEDQRALVNENKQRILLFLSRIHPKKHVSGLLKVWQSLERKYLKWDLWICGPLKSEYSQQMIRLARKLNLNRVCFKGEVLGGEKSVVFQQADLFVLPTHSENFGLVIAEALGHGTPVIVTKGAPWQGVMSENCGWWIENNERSLYQSLSNAMCLSQLELHEMGLRGQRWMKRDFSWGGLATRMLCAYKWLLGRGAKPDCVHEG